MKRKINIIVLLSILFIAYIYVVNITFFPDNILIIEGNKINFAFLYGITINKQENSNPNMGNFRIDTIIMPTSTEIENNTTVDVGKINLQLNLFNTILLKNISVNVLPKVKIIPLGDAIGLKLYTKGVLIVGKSQIEGEKPYEKSLLQEGDMIIEINDEEIDSTEDLIETINQSKGKKMKVKYIRNQVEETTTINAIETKNNEYKIGLWVRDASAGVGTATFYIPDSEKYACLGHGISDIDTEKLITIASGELVTTEIVSITKGEKGKPRRNKRLNRRMHKNRRCISKYTIWCIWNNYR